MVWPQLSKQYLPGFRTLLLEQEVVLACQGDMTPAWLSTSACVVDECPLKPEDGICGHHSKEGVTPGKEAKPKTKK